MKGIILAGGSGTRLYPMTLAISKQLLPVYDKPMIYYPLSVLMLAGIREILVITHAAGSAAVQDAAAATAASSGCRSATPRNPGPKGWRRPSSSARFCRQRRCALILGDNIFYGHGLPELLSGALDRSPARRCSPMRSPIRERYGVVDLRPRRQCDLDRGEAEQPKSNWAVTGLYFYDNEVVRTPRE